MASGGETRIAVEAWEALYRAQATIAQALTAETDWKGLAPREYGVLYALSKAPQGIQITELGEDVLLTQPGMSRLVVRLEERGLVKRTTDPDDARACRIHLTSRGAEMQRVVGLSHSQAVSTAMTLMLSRAELTDLRDLCHRLTSHERHLKPSHNRMPVPPTRPPLLRYARGPGGQKA